MGSCLSKPEPSRFSAVVPYASPQAKRVRLRLFGCERCPLTLRIVIALQFKGIPVQSVWLNSENLHGKKSQLAAFMLPDGKLPILQHEDENICGSPDEILEYIEATFPRPSLLLGGSQMKNVQEWVAYIRDIASPLATQLLYDGDPFSEQERITRLDAAFAKLDAGMAKYSAKGSFFFGDQFSVVDVYLIPFLLLVHPLSYFRGVGISPAQPCLLNYSRRMTNFPSYAPVRMDLDLLHMSVAKAIAESAWPPLITFTMLQHHSMLSHMDKLVHVVDELAGAAEQTAKTLDPVKGSIGMQIKKLATSYGHLLIFLQEHAQMEERVIFPALEKADRGLTKSANQSHARDLPLMNGIKEDLKGVLALEQGSPCRSEALNAVSTRLRGLQAFSIEHFREEEIELLPLLNAAGVGIRQQAVLLENCLDIMDSMHSQLFPFLLSGLQPHQIHQYLETLQKCLENSKTESLMKMINSLKRSDDEYHFIWSLVEDRLPALTSLSSNTAVSR